MSRAARNCEYILLAEFDIDEGSVLRHEYPGPTGCNGHLLAELMLPDGAHLRTEDWTVFYLNQTKATMTKGSSIHGTDTLQSPAATEGLASSLASASLTEPEQASSLLGPPRALLHVMSLVRTKHGAAYKRGALVKALAVCSPLPYIQIFKPVLLLALEDYFSEPTPSVLARLYDSINAIDVASAPSLSINERIVLRQSERKDLFEEKFPSYDEDPVQAPASSSPVTERSITPQATRQGDTTMRGDPPGTTFSTTEPLPHLGIPGQSSHGENVRSRAPSDTSTFPDPSMPPPAAASAMQRKGSTFSTLTVRTKGLRDTHFYDTGVTYNGLSMPIRIPLGVFPAEVGDYSLINLIQTFSNFTSTVGPLHPHLHTNGNLTPPVIVLFNALVTYKRVLFLGGSGSPASQVSNFVLSACALGSGCGQFFGSSMVERAFPYTNLTNLDNVLDVKGYIAGVSNPRFEDLTNTWDVLCNIETGRIVISKDVQQANAGTAANSSSTSAYAASVNSSSLSVSTSSAATGPSDSQQYSASPEPTSAVSGTLPFSHHGQGIQYTASAQNDPNASFEGPSAAKPKLEARLDSSENVFMDEIVAAIQSHFSEAVIRGRFIEYMRRFLRLASRYEEETVGQTSIDYPTTAFQSGRTGSGLVFPTASVEEIRRELLANAGRIEGWRKTAAYEQYRSAWSAQQRLQDGLRAIKNLDVNHVISRLRLAKRMPQEEAEAIYRNLDAAVHSDEQVVELLSHLPPHLGGLLPVAFGLFHPSQAVRDHTVRMLNTLNAHATGAKFVQALNAFHRMAYSRLAQEAAKAYNGEGAAASASPTQHKRQQSSATAASSRQGYSERDGPLPPVPTSA